MKFLEMKDIKGILIASLEIIKKKVRWEVICFKLKINQKSEFWNAEFS